MNTSIIITILGIISSILTIVIWFGSPKRKKAEAKEKIRHEIELKENELAAALDSGDMYRVTMLSHVLRELRQKYKILD